MPNKSVFRLRLKGDEKGRGTAITKLLLFGNPDIFDICLIKQNAQKGEGARKIKCVFLPYEKCLFYQAGAKNVRVPSKPPPPYIKLWRQLTPFMRPKTMDQKGTMSYRKCVRGSPTQYLNTN